MPGKPGSASSVLQTAPSSAPCSLAVESEVSWLWRGSAWHDGTDVFRVMYCFQ